MLLNLCRDPLALAGRRALHILKNVPFSEEELIKKSKTLQLADGNDVPVDNLLPMGALHKN